MWPDEGACRDVESVLEQEVDTMSVALTRAARALAASGAGAAATLATEVAITLTKATKAAENCMFGEVNELWRVENSAVGLCLFFVRPSAFYTDHYS